MKLYFIKNNPISWLCSRNDLWKHWFWWNCFAGEEKLTFKTLILGSEIFHKILAFISLCHMKKLTFMKKLVWIYQILKKWCHFNALKNTEGFGRSHHQNIQLQPNESPTNMWDRTQIHTYWGSKNAGSHPHVDPTKHSGVIWWNHMSHKFLYLQIYITR